MVIDVPAVRPTPPLMPASAPPEPTRPAVTVLSFGIGVAMAPFVMTMIVILAPMRWLFGTPDRR